MGEDADIVLVGGGVMSFTLAAMIKELQPSAHISVYEMLEDVALESSMCWNNAGTGHQSFCELNYTPKKADGSIDITKAVSINQQYELSKEFWAYCVRVGILKEPKTFLNPVPHLSFVVDDINKDGNAWLLDVLDKQNGTKKQVKTKFVFLGAGGGSFPLLQKSGIPEGRGYGGFPVGGLWLVCKNRDIIDKHHAKIYGKASIGDPPMSVPHLDTRIINDKKELLFGPYAGFNTKFLKHGSFFDFPLSMRANNLLPMIQAGIDNVPLTVYLIKQILMLDRQRMKKLNVFIPAAEFKDWRAMFAGQRVQIIKKDANGRGSLQFGTEVITSQDGTLAALLGASPGASTVVNIMLQVLERCFGDKMNSSDWREKLTQMVPSYGRSMEENITRFNECRSKTAETLQMPFCAI